LKAIPNDWPKCGEIEFKNVTLRYDPKLEPVIKDANFHIKPGEKV
jgi:ABC-type multidrug transport system fused ATPase/permease subunit